MNDDIKTELGIVKTEGICELLIEQIRLLRKIAGELPK